MAPLVVAAREKQNMGMRQRHRKVTPGLPHAHGGCLPVTVSWVSSSSSSSSSSSDLWEAESCSGPTVSMGRPYGKGGHREMPLALASMCPSLPAAPGRLWGVFPGVSSSGGLP